MMATRTYLVEYLDPCAVDFVDVLTCNELYAYLKWLERYDIHS